MLSSDVIGDNGVSSDVGAPVGVVDRNPAPDADESAPLDESLRLVVNAWQSLPEPLKAGIVAMVTAANYGGTVPGTSGASKPTTTKGGRP